MEAPHLEHQKQELLNQLKKIEQQLNLNNRGNSTVAAKDDHGDASAPFEGPEKLLELWWESSAASVPHAKGLRAVKRNDWENMLDLVHCKVLSVIQGNGVDAYMLSESSMFVWPHKLILKTCGTTTLLLGLETILQLAASVGFTKGVWRAFYSRKSFMFPEAQKGPHRDWRDEMQVLDRHFVGSGYTVGPMNGDHWLLYISAPRDHVLGHLEDSESVSKELSTPPSSPGRRSPADQSVEILMSDLHPDACAAFYFPESAAAARMDGYTAGKMLSDRLGVTTLFANASSGKPALDSYLFQPCGYSANLIIQQDRYATIHVTPEVECSYASFETNVAFGTDADSHLGLHEMVEKVLAIFRPGRWSLTLFVSKDDAMPESAGEQSMNAMIEASTFKEFRRSDKICYEFEDYDLLFSCFQKKAAIDL